MTVKEAFEAAGVHVTGRLAYSDGSWWQFHDGCYPSRLSVGWNSLTKTSYGAWYGCSSPPMHSGGLHVMIDNLAAEDAIGALPVFIRACVQAATPAYAPAPPPSEPNAVEETKTGEAKGEGNG